MNRQLSQQEIDAVFQNLEDRKGNHKVVQKGVRFDFRRLDRIAKSQLRAIHLLHDNFVRNLGASLSAYLRSYLTVNLVSVEQLSYAEFLEGLPSPTCITSLSLKPYEAERGDAGGRGQAFQELRIGELLHADQIDGQVRAQVGRQAGSEVAHEIVMQQMDGAQLRFGDPVQAPEIEADALAGGGVVALAI